MKRKKIKLATERELRIFMEPLRQRILRAMERAGEPVTPKKLADLLGITPSSAKHHLTRLAEIGLVGIDHTEQIHGITAVFYALLPVDVSIGLEREDLTRERGIVAENLVMSAWAGFRKAAARGRGLANGAHFAGDVLTGFVQLTQAQADELYAKITGFIAENGTRREGTTPFEYALVLYNAGMGHESDA
ncbi:MAG TPA: helix-turn-helix domain-containing protein [Clostridia bacterium]|nr:helix-turn-helix domain-containing protein [Clostridia bacterium]